MADSASLKAIVAELFQTAPAAIGADFPLTHPRFQNSAGRGVLAAAIRRRLGVYSPAVFTASRYGELEAAVLVGRAPAPLSAPAPEVVSIATPAPAARADADGLASIALGVDVEMVESMPETADHWTHEFYRAHFTASEIAYCLRQDHPRMHFAARWCAKEALAKCDARFRDRDPATVQVALGATGQPVLERLRPGGAERLPHAVSLTHTPLLAAAVVAISDVNSPRGSRARSSG